MLVNVEHQIRLSDNKHRLASHYTVPFRVLNYQEVGRKPILFEVM